MKSRAEHRQLNSESNVNIEEHQSSDMEHRTFQRKTPYQDAGGDSQELKDHRSISPNNFDQDNSTSRLGGKLEYYTNYYPSPVKPSGNSHKNKYQHHKYTSSLATSKMSGYTNAFNTFGQNYDEEIIKMKIDELSAEIEDKNKIISKLQNKLYQKEEQYKYLEKKQKSFQTSLMNFSKVSADYDSLHKRYEDQVNENEIMTQEYSRLKDKLQAKEKINQEFQSLTQITVSKFNHFENLNSDLQSINQSLINELNEIKQKVVSIHNGNEGSIAKFDIDVEMLKIQDFYQRSFEDQIKKLIHKYEKQEESLRESLKVDNNDGKQLISKLNEENCNYRKEIGALKRKIEEKDKLFKDKEFELKLEIEDKSREYDKMNISNKSVQKEIKDIESEFKTRLGECNMKIKMLEDKERKMIIDLELKNKKIEESKQEINELVTSNRKHERQIKALEKLIDNYEITLKQASNEINDLKRDIEIQHSELYNADEKSKEDVNMLLSSLEEMKQENERIITENEELKENLNDSTNRINELSTLIQEKYQSIEIMLQKEINQKEALQQSFNDLSKKALINEEKLNQKIVNIKKEYNLAVDNFERLKYKYEQKIQKVMLFYNIDFNS